jgi:hypothetical protein
MSMRSHAIIPLGAGALASALGCSKEVNRAGAWAGTIDTLPSGRIVVHSPKTGLWEETGAPWRVEEVFRIGRIEGTGPDVFGRVSALAVDGSGRVWVFDRQAEEFRVFDAEGKYVRTVGRKGGGPGEFRGVIGLAWGPGGNLWLADPANGRFTVIDTAGHFVTSHPEIGSVSIAPWPGGFDAEGHFLTYVPDPDRPFGLDGILLVVYDSAMTPLDTIVPPRWQGPANEFVYRRGQMSVSTSIPFSPGVLWRLMPSGHIWFALTGEYRIFEIGSSGDTVREISRDFDPVPVTSAEIESAVAGLEWFTRQGGRIDRSRIPNTKPALDDFWVGRDGTLWVRPVVADTAQKGRVLDVFDAVGRYLGRVALPFRLVEFGPPVFQGGMIYGVTRDTLDVNYVVAARVVR